MSLLGSLFGPKIPKLVERGDVDGLVAIVTSQAKGEHRVAALEAVVELAGGNVAAEVIELLGDADPEVDRAAETALRGLGTDAAPALAESLSSPSGDRTLGLLLELGSAAAEPLREASQSDDETTRLRAISGLLALARNSDDEDVREVCFRAVLAAMGDRSPSCRAEAASGLAAFADPRAARALAAQLKDGDETVRTACRDTLRTIGTPAVPFLVDAAGDRNPNSRVLAVGLIATIDTAPLGVQNRQAALVRLLELSDSGEPEVAGVAATALGRIPATDVVQRLLEHLEDPTIDDRDETGSLVIGILQRGALDPGEREDAERRLKGLLASTPEQT